MLPILNILFSVCIFSAHGKVSDSLVKSFNSGINSQNIMVTFSNSVSSVLSNINSQQFSNDADKREAIVSALEQNSAQNQAGVRSMLNQQGVKHETFWISNEIFIQNAPASLVAQLSQAPGVSSIREEEKAGITTPLQEIEVSNLTRQNGNTQWGCQKIQCEYAWHYNRGRGAKVGVLDSGALGGHDALRDNFVGRNENGWFDPIDRSADPRDTDGHGTHVLGTIVGTRNGIGVAPEARWLACRGCSGSDCSERLLKACAEFFFCPTDTNGRNRNCNLAPRVINNSWNSLSSNGNQNWFDDPIRTWLNGNIVSVWSNGNAGPECGTNRYPASHRDVISVGATNENDNLANFSSKGPSAKGGHNKPDVSAPGVNTVSASHEGNDRYRSMQGTSMASPHVAGTIALMLSEKPNASVDNIKKFVSYSVQTDELKRTGYTCGGRSEDNYPNNSFGHGRINAYYAAYYAREYDM